MNRSWYTQRLTNPMKNEMDFSPNLSALKLLLFPLCSSAVALNQWFTTAFGGVEGPFHRVT